MGLFVAALVVFVAVYPILRGGTGDVETVNVHGLSLLSDGPKSGYNRTRFFWYKLKGREMTGRKTYCHPGNFEFVQLLVLDYDENKKKMLKEKWEMVEVDAAEWDEEGRFPPKYWLMLHKSDDGTLTERYGIDQLAIVKTFPKLKKLQHYFQAEPTGSGYRPFYYKLIEITDGKMECAIDKDRELVWCSDPLGEEFVKQPASTA